MSNTTITAPVSADLRHDFIFKLEDGTAYDLSAKTASVVLTPPRGGTAVTLTLGSGLVSPAATNRVAVRVESSTVAGWVQGLWSGYVKVVEGADDDILHTFFVDVCAFGLPVHGETTVYEGESVVTLGSRGPSGIPFPGDQATVTASTPLFDLDQTWNNAAVAFTGLRANFVDTASLAASLLLALQVSGVDTFTIRKDGLLTTLGGGVFGAAVTIAGGTVWHSGNDGAGSGLDADLLDGNSSAFYLDAGNLNAGTLLAARMPALTGDVTSAAGAVATTLATVNANAGSFGSATKATTFTVNAKGLLTAAAEVTITPAWSDVSGKPATAAGMGLTDVVFLTGDQTVAGNKTFSGNFTVGGDLVVNGDTITLNTATLDVEDVIISVGKGNTLAAAPYLGLKAERGATDAFFVWDESDDYWGAFTSANDLTAATDGNIKAGSFKVSASGALAFSGRSQIQSPADGYVSLFNAAGTDFTMLRFGGVSASFPGIQRSGAGLIARLADDSANAAFTAARFVATSPTVTASTPVFNGTQTWNSGAVTFTGLLLNITDTASATASLLGDWQVGGVSQFKVTKAGLGTLTTGLLVGDGSAGAPSVALASSPTTGFYGSSAIIQAAIAGTQRFSFQNGVFAIVNNTAASIIFNTDTTLIRDGAANVLALRNSTNAQAFRAYNTYTDASNYERGFFEWSSNVLEVGTLHNGTGTARALRLKVGAGQNIKFATTSTDRWEINGDGHFVTIADNVYDIGTSGNYRPRTVYIGTSLIVPTITTTSHINGGGYILAGAANIIGWSGRSFLDSPSDGVIRLTNNAQADFSRLQFGGTTSSFPALKRSATVLQARLADDSDFAPLQGKLRTQANAVAETPTATHTMIITDAGGTAYRVLCCV